METIKIGFSIFGLNNAGKKFCDHTNNNNNHSTIIHYKDTTRSFKNRSKSYNANANRIQMKNSLVPRIKTTTNQSNIERQIKSSLHVITRKVRYTKLRLSSKYSGSDSGLVALIRLAVEVAFLDSLGLSCEGLASSF